MANPSLSTRCRSETQVPQGSFFPSRHRPQAQPLGSTSRNSPNVYQKYRETSPPHTRPLDVTKRLRWPPGPVHCSTQPPASASMLHPRSPDSTRFAWFGVKFPLCAPLAALEETSATSLRPAKTASAHPPTAGGACSPIRSNAPGRETPVPSSTLVNTTRSWYRRTDASEQWRNNQRPLNDQQSYREY